MHEKTRKSKKTKQEHTSKRNGKTFKNTGKNSKDTTAATVLIRHRHQESQLIKTRAFHMKQIQSSRKLTTKLTTSWSRFEY